MAKDSKLYSEKYSNSKDTHKIFCYSFSCRTMVKTLIEGSKYYHSVTISCRAGTMKSLRVHFFNRHGIDLDNPGSNASSSLLLALEQSNLPHLMQQNMAAAAAVAAFQNSNNADINNVDTSRSQENGTPPMHYLTPHVEISMADNNESVQLGSPNSNAAITSGLDIQAIVRPKSNPTSSGSEASAAITPGCGASDLRVTTASSKTGSVGPAGGRQLYDSTITPSISLIPIKQELNLNDDGSMPMDQKSIASSMERASPADHGSIDGSSPSTSNLTSLIKVRLCH